MTEILLLGTFHFLESDMDFYTEASQLQLKSIAENIAKFNPDAIAVELAVHEQKAANESYQQLSLSDFEDYEKMKTNTLGMVTIYGGQYPITYNNEAIQIGYRVAKMLNKEQVYAIDDDALLNNDFKPSNKFMNILKEMQDLAASSNSNLNQMLQCYNSDEWTAKNHLLYIENNRINYDNNYIGSEFVSEWYRRNLKIFSNIQKLSEEHSKIFVLYGAGHLKILRDLILASDDMILVDAMSYL